MSTPAIPSIIPGPARPTGIPTPGRPRSSSSAPQQQQPLDDREFAARAFADAIRANDPAHHRPPLPSSQTAPLSGRRSVAGRSSITSSSVPPPRPKTPASARPPSRPASRQSDLFTKSTARAYQVGDNVRIESLGYEGALRYVGEIDAKVGLWAGVELCGGFAGKGKNNGSVNGKQYFSCPANCGVFVAMSKLSPPTVGVGAVPRPPSVASSHGGRVTPALSGRITPSGSSLFGSRVAPSAPICNGRITPSSSGRVTPSLSYGRGTPSVTPAARARRPLAKSTTSNPDPSKFTAGSRASKYVTMTAKQLSSRDVELASPTARVKDFGSPECPLASQPLSTRFVPSPTRHQSPFGTPKAESSRPSIGIPTPTKIRPSLSTPRPRIPSAIAMPPPASPMSARSTSSSDHRFNDLEETILSDSIQDQINSLKSTSTSSFGRPESAMSVQSLSGDDRSLIDRLQSRIEALEYDNERLRNIGQPSNNDPIDTVQVEGLSRERDDALIRIAQLEASLLSSSRAIEEGQAQLSSLEEKHHETLSILDSQKHDMQSAIDDTQEKLDHETDTARSLQATIADRESIVQEKSDFISAQMAEITSLRLRLEALSIELQNEKQDMGAQIDELRTAGQETIALYEERLNAADSEKYELKTRISSLEAGIRDPQRFSHLSSSSHGLPSATEIDNETLREQVLHLQQKVSTMEDIIEDAHVASQREEATLREKIHRLKEKDEGMKKELNEGHREVERMSKVELSARNRVEEIEEALRESTVALENARAEVESLRAELANLDGLVPNTSGGDLYSRVAEVAQRASSDRTRYKEEVAELRQLLEEYRGREIPASGSTNNVEIIMLKEENALLQQAISKQEEKATALSQTLDEYSSEIESLKKKNNREVTIHNGVQDVMKTPSKHDGSAAREEITGLKHIVQELQKENSAAAQRVKLLESENELLLSEAQQLHQEVQILEENLDQGLVPERNENTDSAAVDTPEKLKEQKIRLELERDQLEKQLAEAERKSARSIHNLNKEIGELEALVESKIYREDELEQELERMKEKLARHRKSPKSSSDTVEVQRGSTITSQAVCEICERPGHDIFNCDVLNREAPAALRHGASRPLSDLFCEDCESHGHVAADCPHSLDVF